MNADFADATVKMAGSLLLILGLIFCFFYLMRRFRFRSLSGGVHPRMRLVQLLNLAPKRALALVEVCDQWLVLGVGTESVQLVSKIDRPEEERVEEDGRPGTEKGFRALLHEKVAWQQWRKKVCGGENRGNS
ncbi:MAG: flagellar biosynthetic protein FliO [Deltaproteobacteria bacterium]|nr:flagellar biosynthetic protein FliO [Deltaproteobacteria bacterium]